jgi:hypothetical protein
MSLIPLNTANTLSTAFSPGQDILFGNTSSQAIFTHGDYNIERSSEPDVLTGTSMNLAFTPFSTLENMGVDDFNPQTYTSIQNNELRPISTDPKSYSYFGSFYTEVARSINNVLDTFPYAMLAFDDFQGNTVYDYSEEVNLTTGEKTSKFKIPANTIINQGYVLFNSGSTVGNQRSLMTETNLFEIQLSGSTTAQTNSYLISTYSYTAGTTSTYGVLEFEIKGHLSDGASMPLTGTTSTLPVYIRPSKKRVTEYRMQQSRLERQLLTEGLFDIPDVDDENKDYRYRVPWPRDIDGFNPDTTGDKFETYKDNMLLLAGNVDLDKTDVMIKAIIPDNYLDFDTDTQIYRKVVSSYAKQFDEIKQFIDNIAYAHTINYNDQESIPEKFLVKLSNLLGWKLSSSFSEIDLFEYLADDENPDQNSFAYYNVELWKRILININWLYKKKGTRDALQFLFKLMGAPECLVVFNEFVYEIESSLNDGNIGNSNVKANSRGFINYDASNFIFQEGGKGRGDGQNYINQWKPQFNPIKKSDNIKVQVGDTGFTGSENIVNTKELCATLSPAAAIECDVFDWYKLSGTCWVWGTVGAPYFSGNTTPYEYTIPDCEFVAPDSITAMTFSQYMEYIYASNIEPRNRKTNSQVHTTWGYPELKRIYMNYYLMTEPMSNRLTVKKLEPFLELMEVNFQDYLFQLLPATTILECQGTTYRNTIFHRQRFVYKEGINDGSEFQNALPPDLRPNTTPVQLSPAINDFLDADVVTITIKGKITQGIVSALSGVKVTARINENKLGAGIDAFEIFGEIQEGVSKTVKVNKPPKQRSITL